MSHVCVPPPSTDLDCNAKFWRLIADILNDLANFLDLVAPIFPGMFLPIVCSASIAKVREVGERVMCPPCVLASGYRGDGWGGHQGSSCPAPSP